MNKAFLSLIPYVDYITGEKMIKSPVDTLDNYCKIYFKK
jgi:hypothetical protein